MECPLFDLYKYVKIVLTIIGQKVVDNHIHYLNEFKYVWFQWYHIMHIIIVLRLVKLLIMLKAEMLMIM